MEAWRGIGRYSALYKRERFDITTTADTFDEMKGGLSRKRIRKAIDTGNNLGEVQTNMICTGDTPTY